MKLNHANLCTSNVATLTNIFTRHFNFELVQEANEVSALLKGSDGFSLVLTAMDENSVQNYPNSVLFNFRISFHVGFILKYSNEVYVKHQELLENGYKPGNINIFDALGATWTAFYLPVGDGIDIEVTSHT